MAAFSYRSHTVFSACQNGYSQSALLLAHNRIAAPQLVGTCLIRLKLFVPSLKKPDVDGDISCNLTVIFSKICYIRYRWKIGFFFRQFQGDPVIGGVNGIFQRLVEGIAFCVAAGKIREIAFVGSMFGFMKNSWVSKFHGAFSFFLFFFAEFLFYRSTF